MMALHFRPLFLALLSFVAMSVAGAALPSAVKAQGLLQSLSSTAPVSGAWTQGQHSKWRWIAAQDTAGEQEEILLGLDVQLEGNWKIYWRSPGDAGLPPEITILPGSSFWDLNIAWPAPIRFQTSGIDTIGYKHNVTFPVRAQTDNPGTEQRLDTRIDYLICDDICIPGQVTLRLDIPIGPTQTGVNAELISAALEQVPDQGQRHAMGMTAVSLDADQKDTTQQLAPKLSLLVAAQTPLSQDMDAFVEAGPNWRFSRPDVTLLDGGSKARLVMQGSTLFGDVPPPSLDTMAITITEGPHGSEQRAFEIQAEQLTLLPQLPIEQTPNRASVELLITMLLTAILGGLILNLMPCVLPVLSLKLLSVMKVQSGSHAQARARFLATAAGILTSFLLLACGALALRWAGVAVGWGMQFQQPGFLIFMIVVLSLFAMNLFGLFEFQLPGFLSNLGAVGGHRQDATPSVSGDFLTGMFATLLATPCSAPFLGTALGFALTRGPVEILGIFAALGFGMALPYIAIAAFPAVAFLLPKPGAWMHWVKIIMALALLITAAWLASVLWLQTSVQTVIALAVLVGATAALLTWGLRPLVLACLPLIMAFALPALPWFDADPTLDTEEQTSHAYTPFDQSLLNQAIAQGKTVLVDVTAQWCVTCQVNKRLVLETSDMKNELNQRGVMLMQADWTKPNDTIAAYLAGFDRFGIPFNAVYGPKAPQGLVLPELLTQHSVVQALDAAN